MVVHLHKYLRWDLDVLLWEAARGENVGVGAPKRIGKLVCTTRQLIWSINPMRGTSPLQRWIYAPDVPRVHVHN